MKKKNRHAQKQRSEDKPSSGQLPILAIDTEESNKCASNRTVHSENATGLHDISSWGRFKEWFSKITIAEAGMLLLTLAIAVSSGIYTLYAKRQWKVMTESNRINRTATVIANRAWAKPSFVGPEPDLIKIKELSFPWKVENIGNTPTGPMTIDVVLEIVDVKKEPSFEYSSKHTHMITGTLFPKEEFQFPATLFRPDHSEGQLTDPEFQQLKNGQSYLATFGMITYNDSFGFHQTNFCAWRAFVLGIIVQAKDCVKYNKVDIDNPPK